MNQVKILNTIFLKYEVDDRGKVMKAADPKLEQDAKAQNRAIILVRHQVMPN